MQESCLMAPPLRVVFTRRVYLRRGQKFEKHMHGLTDSGEGRMAAMLGTQAAVHSGACVRESLH